MGGRGGRTIARTQRRQGERRRKTDKIQQKREKNQQEGQGRGAFPSLSGLVLGVQIALNSNSGGWAVPIVPTGLPASPSPASFCFPRCEQNLAAVSRTTTNNDILHSCQDKGESRGGRGKLGSKGTPPGPCTSLGVTRRGPPGRAGMVGKKGGPGGAGLGVPGTHQHLFPGDLAVSVGYRRAHPKEQRLTWGAFLGLPEGPGAPLCSGTWGVCGP